MSLLQITLSLISLLGICDYGKPHRRTVQKTISFLQGVTFAQTADLVDEAGSLVPYGLPCVRELFRFLISLINPHDQHNQDTMVQVCNTVITYLID